MQIVNEALVRLDVAGDEESAFVCGRRGDDRDVKECLVVARLGARFLEQRAALHRLEGPCQGAVVLLIDVRRDISYAANIYTSQTVERLGVAAVERTPQAVHVLFHLLDVKRVGGVWESSASDGARLMDSPREEGIAVSCSISVMVKVLNADCVGARRLTPQRDGGRITPERGDVCLYKLEEETLVPQTQVQ